MSFKRQLTRHGVVQEKKTLKKDFDQFMKLAANPEIQDLIKQIKEEEIRHEKKEISTEEFHAKIKDYQQKVRDYVAKKGIE